RNTLFLVRPAPRPARGLSGPEARRPARRHSGNEQGGGPAVVALAAVLQSTLCTAGRAARAIDPLRPRAGGNDAAGRVPNHSLRDRAEPIARLVVWPG